MLKFDLPTRHNRFVAMQVFFVRLDIVQSTGLKENFVMKRFGSRWVLLLAASLTPRVAAPATAQSAAKPAEPAAPKMLVLSPATAPVPALRYRLLPSSVNLVPGDAAPIYLRAHGYEDSFLDQAWRDIRVKSNQWQELPLKELPTAEVRKFVNLWSGKLKQIEFGTRRKTCEWNYTLPEQQLDAINILLPDAQSMRQWARVLTLKARVEIAEGQYDEAIATIETGVALARHVALGPFLVNALVGVAMADNVLATCDDLIAGPGAPNLYWALTTLPQPLISLRYQFEVEQGLVESMIPELREAELIEEQTDAAWGLLLSRMHKGIVKWSRAFGEEKGADSPVNILAGWDLARFKSESLPAAREYLKTSRKRTDAQLAAMSPDQMVAIYIAGRFRELRDDFYKAGYLPAPEALAMFTAAEERIKGVKPGPLAFFVQSQIITSRAIGADLRLDRRVAALRVIEALRMYAASHDGALPESLSQITEVPVPDDPATRKPFEYSLTGNSVLLSAPQAGLSTPWPSYRITMRR
jgi:hypothetical protein